MQRRGSFAFALLLVSASATAADTLLYEDFQDGSADHWQAFGDGEMRITTYQGNASLRMSKDAVAVRSVPASGVTRVRIGASFAASGLEHDEACIGEATFDDGTSWFEVLRVVNGQDDSITLHWNGVSRDVPEETEQLWFRARVTGNRSNDTCWLDNVYIVAEVAERATAERSYTRVLSPSFLLSNSELAAPVSMREFALPNVANAPENAFSGTLRLNGLPDSGHFTSVTDDFGRESEVGESLRHLPEFEFQFVQRGNDVIPLQRGVIRRTHPYWEIILQPGKAWNEVGDKTWTRASIPFSLQERSANCTHNGVLSWLFNHDGDMSRVAYQISSETCAYLKFNMWGAVTAEYERQDLHEAGAAHIRRLDEHRRNRLPVRPLVYLAKDHPGVDTLSFGVDDGIHPDDVTVLGMQVDGVHYRSDCNTRHGAYPYCDSLPLPSYSTAKSIFAALATMRLEKLHPGVTGKSIGSLVEDCSSDKWRDVSIHDALDMATGNSKSRRFNEDEDSPAHVQFLFSDNHAQKLDFACNYFKHKRKPGSTFVYHTSDTYLIGTALTQFVAENDGPGADLYQDVLVQPIWNMLRLSPLLDDTKQTYDDASQPFTGYGLTYEIDDILRIADWLNNGRGRIEGEPILDDSMLDAALQRTEVDRGLPAGPERLIYNNGFWAFDTGPSIACKQAVWVPFMSGFGGITVAMFPNGVTYYYFSDSYVYGWQSGSRAANMIRSMCK